MECDVLRYLIAQIYSIEACQTKSIQLYNQQKCTSMIPKKIHYDLSTIILQPFKSGIASVSVIQYANIEIKKNGSTKDLGS